MFEVRSRPGAEGEMLVRDGGRLLGLLLGPLVWLLTWYATPKYAAIGIMAWAAIYWASGAVPVIWTALIPLIGFGLIGVPLPTILMSFFHPALLLIVGPTVVIVAAVHCGLMERMALFFINWIGPSVRAQTLFWLVFSTVISDFAADVVVALAMIPIVMKILHRAGFKTVHDVAASKEAMLLVIATAIGASLGGILTPMAGGQAAITWAGLNKALGGEVTALSFTLRMFPPTTVCLFIVGAVFWFLAAGGKRFFFGNFEEYRKYGTDVNNLNLSDLHVMLSVDDGYTYQPPWSRHEKVVAVLLALAVLLPYARPWLPFSLPWIYIGLLVLTLALWVPGVGMVLPLKALRAFPLNAVSVWPIAMSVSTLVGVVGSGQQVLDLVGNIWAFDPWVSVGLWVALCVGLAQVASDTGSAGMLIPLLTDALPKIGMNPVPWIMMTGFSVDFSFMAPTATGTIGVLYALGGRSHFRLPLYGGICAVACALWSWVFWSMVISNNWSFWYSLDIVR